MGQPVPARRARLKAAKNTVENADDRRDLCITEKSSEKVIYQTAQVESQTIPQRTQQLTEDAPGGIGLQVNDDIVHVELHPQQFQIDRPQVEEQHLAVRRRGLRRPDVRDGQLHLSGNRTDRVSRGINQFACQLTHGDNFIPLTPEDDVLDGTGDSPDLLPVASQCSLKINLCESWRSTERTDDRENRKSLPQHCLTPLRLWLVFSNRTLQTGLCCIQCRQVRRRDNSW